MGQVICQSLNSMQGQSPRVRMMLKAPSTCGNVSFAQCGKP